MSTQNILILHGQSFFIHELGEVLTSEKCRVSTSFDDCLSIYSTHRPDIDTLIIDTAHPQFSAQWFTRLAEEHPLPYVIALTPAVHYTATVDLMKNGASEVLVYPILEQTLELALERANTFQLLIDITTREMTRNNELSIHKRLTAFKELLDIKRAQNQPISPGELQLFFPHTSLSDTPMDDLIHAIQTNTLTQLVQHTEKPSVLIIEDEPGLIKALKRFLADTFEVSVATNAKEAKEQLAIQSSYDVILLDIGLPDIQGNLLVEEIKKHDKNAIIVMLTAFNDTHLIVSTMRQGAIDYIVKPFDGHNLQTRLSQLVNYKATLRLLDPLV